MTVRCRGAAPDAAREPREPISLEGPAERIVTFGVPFPSVIIGLDQSVDRLVGIHPESMGAIERGTLG